MIVYNLCEIYIYWCDIIINKMNNCLSNMWFISNSDHNFYDKYPMNQNNNTMNKDNNIINDNIIIQIDTLNNNIIDEFEILEIV